MTEEELTQAAILKAQSLEKEKKAPVAPVAQPAPVKAKVKKEVETDEYPYIVQLGKNKIVHFNTWTGKTKKQLKKLITEDTPAEEDFDKVMKVLLIDHIQEKDMFFSEVEQQFTLLKIREESLTDEFVYSSYCEKCEDFINISSVIDECIQYTPNKYPEKYNDINIVDITSQTDFRKTVKDYFDEFNDDLTTETDIEIALHIQNGNMTPAQVMEWMDNMSLKDLKVISEKLSDASSKLEISLKTECPKCGTKSTFKTSQLPNIFADLTE